MGTVVSMKFINPQALSSALTSLMRYSLGPSGLYIRVYIYTNIECLLAHLSSAVGFIPTVNGTMCDMVEVLIIFLLLLAGGIID